MSFLWMLLIGGGLVASLLATRPAAAVFQYQVYTGSFSALPNFGTLTPTASGTSATIGVGVTGLADNFALVFTNTIQVPTTGIYEFYTHSDDGSKLYVDGAVVVDNDGLHGPQVRQGTRQLSAGSHALRVEFFERTGGQVVDVGYRTGNPDFQPIPSNGQLAYTSANESEYGAWGPVIQWPHIAISAANLPDGRVLSWSSTETNAFPSGPNFTHASVFDPVTESFINVDSDFHDMFCAGISTLENGTIVASGGNPSDRRTSAFNPATLSWSPLANMIDLRWYATNVTMPDNRIFTSFGKDAGNRSEIYDSTTDTWTPTPNANMQTLVSEQNAINAAPNPGNALTQEWWAHLAVTPQGDLIQAGPTPTWHRFDPIGGAANVVLGQPIGDRARMYGNAVTYGVGKMLIVGGADRRLAQPTSVNNVYRIDLNGPAPTVTPGAPMNYPRALSNTVTLPTGELLVIGGNTVARIFTDEGAVLPAEIYDPEADAWRIVDSINVPRNYHSTALLLKDGRVLSAGGGACGNGCAANHLDGQIFSPPYLFEADDTPAIRPTLSLPGSNQVRAGDALVVDASPGATFSIVRLSGTTHHLNTDQRYLPIPSVDHGDGTHTLTFPANPNVLILGNYFLFALDADGTPSIAEIVQVLRDPVPAPEPGAVYLSDLPWTSETNGWGPAERDRSNGETAAGDGPPLRLDGVTYAKGIGAHAYSEIGIDLAGQYDRFRARIGLDDARDGLCGEIQFEVAVDNVVRFQSGTFVESTPSQAIDLDVAGGQSLALRLYDLGATCGDHGDWADARLLPLPAPGFRYYRFRPTQLRNDAAANSIQIAELALFQADVRQHPVAITNPGGNNPVGEEPVRADDEDVATKWLDFNRGAIVYDYGVPVEIDAYTITTANDAPDRDPVRWALEGSIDGSTWEVLDDQTGADYPTPTARQTESDTIPIVLLEPVVALPAAPRHSTTLLVETSSGEDRIWNVNPDNDTVTVSSAAGVVLAEIPVGDRPWSLAKRPGQPAVYVVDKGSASISVIDTASLAVDHTVPLPRASAPHGLVFSSDGATYYVVLEALAELQKRDAANDGLVSSLALGGRPRHLSITPDDAKLLVSNFITPPIPGESTTSVDVANGAGEVFAVDAASLSLSTPIALPHDDRAQTESQGPGMPNYVGPAVVDFAGTAAYVPSKKDNVRSGATRGVSGMTFEATVRANTSRILLATDSEDPSFRVDHDNASLATGAALTGDGRYLLVTLETSRELAVYDLQNGFQLMRLPTGRAPQSVALSSDGATAYVHDFMDRQVSRFDLTEMLQTRLPATNPLPAIAVVGSEALAPNVLLGKQLFYDAQDDRLALDNYMSCATCHNEGDSDGRVWDLGAFGEGLRNTIDLRGKGTGHGRPHWTGNFDEIQDFEGQIRNLNLGLGLLSNVDFLATEDPLGAPKAGLDPDLDALAAYVNSLTTAPPSPFRPSAGAMSASAVAGRQAFASQGCLGCHAVSMLTDSPTTVRHDVGTIDAATGQRLGGPIDGLDTPGLLSLWANPPYLHDGSAATIEAAIAAHDDFAGLDPTTLGTLAAFLREAEAGDVGPLFDDDGDGTVNLDDAGPTDPCVPTAFVAVCAQDSDGDGLTDDQETATADGDGDGTPDWLESATADADGDGVPDQADPENANACVPDPEACAPAPQVPVTGPLARLLLLGSALGAGAARLRRRRSG
ncbi:MAG: NPCBM/NEW2 domain-containing protein [Myxococcota bacterium]